MNKRIIVIEIGGRQSEDMEKAKWVTKVVTKEVGGYNEAFVVNLSDDEYEEIAEILDVPVSRGVVDRLTQLIRQAAIRARIDEREKMKFINADGTETFAPFMQYRSTIDGLLVDWDTRTEQLEQQLSLNEEEV